VALGLWFLAGFTLLLLAGIGYQWAGRRRDGRRFPPPGRMVRLPSGVRIHLRDRGEGPAVWLEAGIAASSISWKPVEDAFLARGFRVFAMDRAGYGWSDAPRGPRSIPVLVEELRQVVVASDAPTPLVMVGHSFGGLLLRHYAERYPADVAALVLLDPLEPLEYHPVNATQAYRLRRGTLLSRRGATLARFGVVRFALDLLLAGGRTIPRLLAKVSSGRGSAVTDRLAGEIRKLPSELWPVVAAHWCLPRSFHTLADYLERLPANCSEPLNFTGDSGIPVAVVSARTTPESVQAAHRSTAGCAGLHVLARDSGHWVQLDRPDLAVELVTKLTHSDTKHKR
jgi:pimeloyl-ACP methyl ester carboxylesterase